MAGADGTKKINRISVLNWMGTLILCSIPGVNVIVLILTIILAKTQPKRTFAIAMLILWILAAALICAAFIAFPNYMAQLADMIRGTQAAQVVVP